MVAILALPTDEATAAVHLRFDTISERTSADLELWPKTTYVFLGLDLAAAAPADFRKVGLTDVPRPQLAGGGIVGLRF